MITGLVLDADLDIAVDGATGRLTGNGRQLHLEIDRPDVLAAATGRGIVAALAAGLAQAGITAELHGPRGRIAHLDPYRTSRLGALVTGSRHVGIDAAAWPLAGGLARRAVTTRRAIAALVGASIVTIAVRRWSR